MMRYRRTVLVVGAAVLLLGLTPVLGENILVNPGFETGAMDPWYQDAGSGPEPWNVTNAEAHTGSYSATDVGNQRIRQDFDPFPTADITEVSFWVMQPGGDDAGTTGYAGWFRYQDGSSEQVGTTFTPGGLPEWTLVNMTAYLDPAKNLVAFGVWGYSGGGPAEDRTYLDDVRIMGEQGCPGDIDGDGDTDHSDLGELLSAWCTHPGDPDWNPDADLDGDGHVGHGDLGILLADWGCGTAGAPGPDGDGKEPSALPESPVGGAEPVSVGEVTR